jgi:condensation domain-containing protein
LSAGAPRDHALSYGQRALWFVQRLAPGATAYNVNLAARAGELDAAAFRAAWQALADRHPALRTTYPTVAGQPVARVHPRLEIDFAAVDAGGWPDTEIEARLAAEAHRPHDLERGPAVRLSLLRRSEAEHALLFGMHHIGVDFTSLALLIDELGALYAARRQGREAALPPLSAAYEDFVRWQADLLAGMGGEELLAYWRGRLAGAPPALALPADRPRPRVQGFRGGLHQERFAPDLTAALKALAAAQGVSLSTLLLAAFQALLHRYTAQQDVLVGSPVPGRGPLGFADVVGYFVNTVVLRADFAGAPTFRALLARTRQRVAEALAHQDYPFPLLVERLRPQRDPAVPPFFQVFFVLYEGSEQRIVRLLTGEGGAALDVGGLALAALALPGQAAMFDLSLLMCDAGDRVVANFQYSSDLFDPSTIARLVADYTALLAAVAADPDRPVATLPASLGAARAAGGPAAVAPTPTGEPLAESHDRADTRRALLERQKRLRGSARLHE